MMKSLRYNKDSGGAPILSISNGHEPLMSSYNFCNLDEVITNFIKLAKKKELKMEKMMRMQVFEDLSGKSQRFLTNFSS